MLSGGALEISHARNNIFIGGLILTDEGREQEK